MGEKETRKQTEARIKSYYESLIIKDRLSFKREKLEKEKKELAELCERYPDTISQEDYNKARERLIIVNSQLADTEGNIRFLETEHADMQYALSTLNEEQKQIIEKMYKQKKYGVAIGYEMFMSCSGVSLKKKEILNYLYGILS